MSGLNGAKLLLSTAKIAVCILHSVVPNDSYYMQGLLVLPCLLRLLPEKLHSTTINSIYVGQTENGMPLCTHKRSSSNTGFAYSCTGKSHEEFLQTMQDPEQHTPYLPLVSLGHRRALAVRLCDRAIQ